MAAPMHRPKFPRAMRILFSTVIFLSLAPLSLFAQEAVRDPRVEPLLSQARAIAHDLAEQIRGKLLQELQKGGFDGAVRVCSVVAQEIPREVTSRTGRYVRRVSLKVRNPQNAPDPYEQETLESLSRLQQEKQLPPESYGVVREENSETLRYMKPLVIAPLCLNCHGTPEQIPAEVRRILKERYPNDRATGYREGDLRGAISIRIHLPPR